MTIEEGKVEIGRILNEEAGKQNVSIDRVIWFDNGTSEKLATRFTLQVRGTKGMMTDKEFSPEHLTRFQSDNQLLMQVHEKIIGIVVKLR